MATNQEVYDSLTSEQRAFVHMLLREALLEGRSARPVKSPSTAMCRFVSDLDKDKIDANKEA